MYVWWGEGGRVCVEWEWRGGMIYAQVVLPGMDCSQAIDVHARDKINMSVFLHITAIPSLWSILSVNYIVQ